MTTTPITIAVDPGNTGAIAFLRGADLLQVHDMPTRIASTKRRRNKAGVMVDVHKLAVCADSFRTILSDAHRAWSPTKTTPHVVIERQGSRPGEGAYGAFRNGEGFGTMCGVVVGVGWVLTVVSPATWKKALDLGTDKGASLAMARTQWPEHAETFKRLKDHDRAEASLIGLWIDRVAS